MSGPRLHIATRALPPDLVTLARAADVDDETIFLADEAVSWAPGLLPPERGAFGLIVLALQEARGSGSSRLSLATVPALLERMGVETAERGRAARLVSAPPPALLPLVGAPGDYKPFLVDDGCLYAHRDWLLEDRLARALAARLAAPLPALETGVLDEAVARAAPPGRDFTAAQHAALRAALTQPLTVITGGPGTGKTALLVGIVRALRHLGLGADEIALAAPTGRAANRIAESLGASPDALGASAQQPQTLHRLLGFRGGRAAARAGEFRHHENFPLRERAVLVDEASMIDLGLMERLARALRPDARLVLVGDADQLPSVDAGAVFRELGAFALRLAESHRQDPRAPAGASVLAAARAVHSGDARALDGTPKTRPVDLTWSGFELLSPSGAAPAADRRLVAAFADHWIRARVHALPTYAEVVRRVYGARDGVVPFEPADTAALRTLVAHHQSLRVLCVTRGEGAPTGAEALNLLLARRAAAHLEDEAARADADADAPAAGTPVLMIRNDYDRGLFNGDQGVVVRAARAGEAPHLMAVFPRGEGLTVFPFESLRDDLRVAYATTVHKAQGAELDHVALVLPERDLPLLSRELVYTALTRARTSAVVVGRGELLALAVGRPLERSSGLGARLAALGGTSV